MKNNSSLSEKVANLIRVDIKKGNFETGKKIPAEPALMERYGVGRSSIREAVKSLTLSGILSVMQGYGTVVNEVSSEPIEQRLRASSFEEINYVRAILEKEIVALAIRNRNQDDIERIEIALERRRMSINDGLRRPCVDADINFHLSIAQACGNQVLIDLYESFTTIIRDFFSRREPEGIAHFALSHHFHEHLFEAIKLQDLDAGLNTIETILNNNH